MLGCTHVIGLFWDFVFVNSNCARYLSIAVSNFFVFIDYKVSHSLISLVLSICWIIRCLSALMELCSAFWIVFSKIINIESVVVQLREVWQLSITWSSWYRNSFKIVESSVHFKCATVYGFVSLVWWVWYGGQSIACVCSKVFLTLSGFYNFDLLNVFFCHSVNHFFQDL